MLKLILILLFTYPLSSFAELEECNSYWVVGKIDCDEFKCTHTINFNKVSPLTVDYKSYKLPIEVMYAATRIKILQKFSANHFLGKIERITPIKINEFQFYNKLKPKLAQVGLCNE